MVWFYNKKGKNDMMDPLPRPLTPFLCSFYEDGDQFGVQLGKERGIYVRKTTV